MPAPSFAELTAGQTPDRGRYHLDLEDSAYLPNALQSWEEISFQEEQKQMAPNEGYVTTEDGVPLFFQKMGSGPKAVVIPNATHMFDDFKYLAGDRTLIFYDLRNRGRSDSVTEASKLKGGIHNGVEDLETIRRQFGVAPLDVIGHSYLGMVVALYAMKLSSLREPRRSDRFDQDFPRRRVAGRGSGSEVVGLEG